MAVKEPTIDIERENVRRKMFGHRPYGEECDYVGCHESRTVAAMGRWRLCVEHAQPTYHPPHSHIVADEPTTDCG